MSAESRYGATQASCAWSAHESDAFFCVSDEDWARKRQIFVESLRQSAVDDHPVPYIFWQNNWEPNFSCAFERRPGAPGDGAKWVCDPHRIVERECLLYSFGSANNFAWEESMHALLPACEIHTFDHTVRNGSVHTSGDYVRFHHWGVGGVDRWLSRTRNVGVFTLGTIRRMLGHEGRAVEVLKIDVEGAEYDLLMPLIQSRAFDFVRQLQVKRRWQLARAMLTLVCVWLTHVCACTCTCVLLLCACVTDRVALRAHPQLVPTSRPFLTP